MGSNTHRNRLIGPVPVTAMLACCILGGGVQRASAQWFSMETSRSIYQEGEPITVIMTGGTVGATAAQYVLARVVYGNPALVDGLSGTASQDIMTSGLLSWDPIIQPCDASSCLVIGQTSPGGFPVTPDPMVVTGVLEVPTLSTGTLEISIDEPSFAWFGEPPPLPIQVAIEPPPPMEKVSDTQGYLSGPGSPGTNPGGLLADGDQFGSEVTGIGDLDGDGVPDLAVGASTDDLGGVDAGAIYVLFMNPDGTVKALQKIGEGTGGLQADLDPDDRFGSDLALLHDVDGDGVQDLAVAAYNDDDGASNAGALYILFMNPDGTVKDEQKISNVSGGLGPVNDADDGFGQSPAGIGDLDGDGIPDVAAGSFLDNHAGGNAGSLYILFLNADGTVKASQKITEGVGGFTGNLDVSDRFGSGLANLGDLDGDGRPELAVGARFAGANDAGVIYLLSLNADGTVHSHVVIEQGVMGFYGPTDPLDRFSRPARVGDLDGDGVGDMAVGAVTDDDSGLDAGALWILFLSPNGFVHDERKISLVPGLQASDFFGAGVTSPGDLDGDGVSDLVVGANGDDDGGANRGAAYVLLMDGSPAVCGNGVLDPLEGCDDGNTVSGDGCDGTCLVPLPESGSTAMLASGVVALQLLGRRRRGTGACTSRRPTTPAAADRPHPGARTKSV